jgi:hypothetical protein
MAAHEEESLHETFERFTTGLAAVLLGRGASTAVQLPLDNVAMSPEGFSFES